MTDPNHFEEGHEAPPPGVRVMAAVRWLMLAAMALVAFVSVYSVAAPGAGTESAEHRHEKYWCPMHHEIRSDVPGECPICHMTLELIPEEQQKSTPSGGSAALPAVPSAAPRVAKKGAVTGGGAASSAPPPSPPPEVSPVRLTFDRVQAIGVRTDVVTATTSREPLRVAAVLEAPERSAAEVHVRTPGFLESIAVREVGVRVRAGQPLATVYSADVLKAEEELLAVLDWKPGPSGEKPPVEDSRRRLELLGVPRATIDHVVQTKAPVHAIAIAAPIDGYVVRKSAVLGAFVTPETSLFDIVGLDRVYVVASVDPSVLARVKVGDRARFVTPALPGRTFDAKVDLIYPFVDAVARVARVRFSLENADQTLRPGQVGTAELAEMASSELTVPLDAVVQTGRAAYVFVVEEAGKYAPRAVQLGEERGERVAVQGELREGDRVVSRATFLVDSESRIRSSFVESASPAADHASHVPGAGP